MGRSHFPTDLVSISQAAEIVGVNREVIARWVRRGLIQAYGRRGCLRVSLTDVICPYEPQPSCPVASNRKQDRA
jgi:hypothetical protein